MKLVCFNLESQKMYTLGLVKPEVQVGFAKFYLGYE